MAEEVLSGESLAKATVCAFTSFLLPNDPSELEQTKILPEARSADRIFFAYPLFICDCNIHLFQEIGKRKLQEGLLYFTFEGIGLLIDYVLNYIFLKWRWRIDGI